MKKTSKPRHLLSLAALSLATAAHAQTVIVADNFDTDFGGLSGNNNVTPVGGAPWTGNSIQVISPDYTSGQVAADYTGNGNVGDVVPLNIVNGGVVTENVDLYMSSAGWNAGHQNSTYIGFGTGGAGSLNNGSASSFQWSGSALNASINEQGNGFLEWNGNDIADFSASGFQPDEENAIALSYNTFNQLVTLSVAGTQVASATLSSPISLNYAGFSEFYGVGFNYLGYDGATSFDNFSVVEAVPEPSAWPILASGVGALALLRRRVRS